MQPFLAIGSSALQARYLPSLGIGAWHTVTTPTHLGTLTTAQSMTERGDLTPLGGWRVFGQSPRNAPCNSGPHRTRRWPAGRIAIPTPVASGRSGSATRSVRSSRGTPVPSPRRASQEWREEGQQESRAPAVSPASSTTPRIARRILRDDRELLTERLREPMKGGPVRAPRPQRLTAPRPPEPPDRPLPVAPRASGDPTRSTFRGGGHSRRKVERVWMNRHLWRLEPSGEPAPDGPTASPSPRAPAPPGGPRAARRRAPGPGWPGPSSRRG